MKTFGCFSTSEPLADLYFGRASGPEGSRRHGPSTLPSPARDTIHDGIPPDQLTAASYFWPKPSSNPGVLQPLPSDEKRGGQVKKLPLSTNTFKEIIEGGQVYVHKTRYLHEMATIGKAYFLSRPRRFGKSLLVSAL